VEFLPVVEVIEADSVLGSMGVIGETIGAQDRLASFVVVIVTSDGGIQFIDRSSLVPFSFTQASNCG
jgi:hypothetical protein